MKGFKEYLKEMEGSSSSGDYFQDMSAKIEKISEIYERLNKMAGELTFDNRKDEEYLMDLAAGLETLLEGSQEFNQSVQNTLDYIHEMPMGQD